MKLLDEILLVNGWTIAAGHESQFVHYAKVIDGESHNNNGNIRITYQVKAFNEEGEDLFMADTNPSNLEYLEVIDDPEDAPVDKERPERFGPCPRCDEDEARFCLLEGRTVRYGGFTDEGPQYQCMECSYTYYHIDPHHDSSPGWLIDEIKDEYEEGELSHAELDWAQRHSLLS